MTAGPAGHMTGTLPCLWCGMPIKSHRGGSPGRFCSRDHRTQFWTACRKWAERAVVHGTLTVADLRNADSAACTLLAGRISPAPSPEQGGTAETPSFGDRLYRVLDEMSAVELVAIPEPLWLLIEPLARPDAHQ